MVLSVTAALSMPAGAISGVAVVMSGLGARVVAGAAAVGVLENSAMGTVSVGKSLAPGVLERPQLHGAYQEP